MVLPGVSSDMLYIVQGGIPYIVSTNYGIYIYSVIDP